MSTLEDYRAWHHLQVETQDLDPVYPVLRVLADRWGLDEEERAWLCICHVVYYHLGSTLTLFERVAHPSLIPADEDGLRDMGLLSLPCTTERRGHRPNPPLIKHLLGLRRDLGDDVWGWLGANGWGWPELNERITQLQGNGRWAAYKLAEMLQKVAGVPTQATDAGHRYSTGPRKGLVRLYGDEELPEGQDAESIAQLDRITEGLRRWVDEPDVAQVETSLCDFNSLAKGGYYLGHDIDGMQEVLSHPAVDPTPLVWDARREVFDNDLLGELNGWDGIRRGLKPVYRDQGIIDIRRIA